VRVVENEIFFSVSGKGKKGGSSQFKSGEPVCVYDKYTGPSIHICSTSFRVQESGSGLQVVLVSDVGYIFFYCTSL
jgi:hypothetical protein